MLAGLDAFNPSFLADLNATESAITQLNQQISSGVRVNEASDDPSAVAPIIDYQTSLDQITQAQTNLQTVNAQATSADTALQTASSLMNQLVTIATEGSSGTSSAANNAVLAQQVNSIEQQMIGLANTSVQGEYIFGGDSANVQPYTYSTSSSNDYINNNPAVTNTETLSNADGTSMLPRMAATSIFDDANGPSLAANTLNITTPGATFVTGSAGVNDQTFTFNYIDASGASTSITAKLTASAGGYTLIQALNSLNTQLSGTGVSAGVNSSGELQFTSSVPFSVADNNAPGGGAAINSALTNYGVATSGGSSINGSVYSVTRSASPAITAGNDELVFTTSSGKQISVDLTAANSGNVGGATPASIASATASTINAATASYGIYAIPNANNAGISFQSAANFSVTEATDPNFAGTGVLGANAANQSPIAQNVTAPTASVSILETISSLAQGLAANNQQQIQGALTSLQAGVAQINQASIFYGNVEDWIQQSQQQATTDQDSETQALSSIKDTDVAAAATQLTTDQTALEAALSAHGTLSVKSLFSYLG